LRAWSIRTRLTLLFALVLGAVLFVIAGTTWYGLRRSFAEAIDRSLTDHGTAIGRLLINEGTPASLAELRDDLREYVALDPGWNMVRILDAAGTEIYCSPALAASGVGPDVRDDVAPPRFRDIVVGEEPFRIVSMGVGVGGERFAIEVALPTKEIESALARFRLTALLLIPVAMLAAALAGYGLARTALAPVDRIAGTARKITSDRLDLRLDVPPTGDELQRLSETLNEMLDRLHDAFRRTRRFTADASHELRTPVALVQATAEVALRRERSADEYRSALRKILGEAERTSGLIDNLLTLARADAGAHAFARERLDLGQLIADHREILASLCADRGLEFRFERAAAPHVRGDRSALSRVLVILFSNAVRYTPAPGVVRLTVGEVENHAVIGVDDTGIGITAEDLPHVFERFYRADRARSRDRGGEGLGLSIAKWIVEQHGGGIRIESEPGKGCWVHVTLPADQAV